MTGYHVTPKKNRGAIRRYGLIPRDTTSHPRSHFHLDGFDAAWRNKGVEAVYVHETLEAAMRWRDTFYAAYRALPEELDIWRVDVTGLPTEDDPYRYDAYYLHQSVRVLERVTPDRLELAA